MTASDKKGTEKRFLSRSKEPSGAPYWRTLLTAVFLVLIVFAAYKFPFPRSGSFKPGSFSFEGGSGRISIECDEVTLRDGSTEALIVFSSPNYAYVKENGIKYEGSYTEKSSAFRIPVVLDNKFKIIGCTTAMSTPHEVEYELFISLNGQSAGDAAGNDDLSHGAGKKDAVLAGTESSNGNEADTADLKRGFSDSDAPRIEGLDLERSLDPKYAECFDVFYYSEDYRVIAAADGERYLIIPKDKDVPRGLPDDITVIHEPENIYLAATAAMSLFSALDAEDRIKFSGTDVNGWYIDPPKDALKNGRMVFAGKYSAPDYEMLLSSGCDLAVESTMILHSPEIKEQLKRLGIPVFTDYSSYEKTAAGKEEWIFAYAAMLGMEEEAEKLYANTVSDMKKYEGFEKSGKEVALFYINKAGLAVVRGDEDYLTELISEGGGENPFAGLTPEENTTSVYLSMESFFDRASDADYIIYNATIDGTVESFEDLLSKSALLKDFKAVKNGNVYLLDKEFYQSTDKVHILAGDINSMLNGEDSGMVFLRKLS